MTTWFLPSLVLFELPQIFGELRLVSFQKPVWIGQPDVIVWSPVIAILLAIVLRLVGRSLWVAPVFLLALPFTTLALLLRNSQGGVVFELSVLCVLSALMVTLRLFGFRIRVERVRRDVLEHR